MKKVFCRPVSLKRMTFHYCAGCGHSIIHRLIAEVIDEMDLRERVVGVNSAGCSVFAYHYFDIDMAESAHGRGLAVATGLKRASPGSVVFTYQGDGDLAAIGTAETIHAANRGERVTAIFVNNAVYGMTGGQMAPTTLITQETTTTPYGRDPRQEGYPVKVSEMLALLNGVAYVERTAVNSPVGIRRTKKAIQRAFQTQIDDLGFSLVEVLSPCPINWKMSVIDSWRWIDNVMTKEFPLGVLKEPPVQV